MSRSDFKAAAEDYRQAVKMHPESAEMWANLGLMEHEEGDYAEAIRSFQQAIRLKPGLYVPNLFLGIDSMHTGNTSAAIQFLVKAERMNKTDPEAPLELGRAYSLRAISLRQHGSLAVQSSSIRNKATHGSAREWPTSTRWKRMPASCRPTVPHSSYAQALYAESMARQSRYLEATDSFRKAIGAQPQPPCLHAEFGFMYAKQQKWQDAESEFEQESGACGIAEFLEQEHASGRIDADMYQSLTAARSAESEQTRNALNAQAESYRGEAKVNCCGFPLAPIIPVITRSRRVQAPAVSRDGRPLLVHQSKPGIGAPILGAFRTDGAQLRPSHVLLGDMYRQRQRYDDAQTQYKLALEISPADHAALLGLAYAYFGNANIDATIATARLRLAATPGDPELNLLMGEALIARHDFAGAEPFLQKGLAAKPQMLPHVHALLGTVYAETGRTQDAIAQLEMGLAADGDGSTHYKLARMYRKAGDTKKADAAMQQVKAAGTATAKGSGHRVRGFQPAAGMIYPRQHPNAEIKTVGKMTRSRMRIRSSWPLIVVFCTIVLLCASPSSIDCSLPNGIDIRLRMRGSKSPRCVTICCACASCAAVRLPEDASWAVLPDARTSSVTVTPEITSTSAGFRTSALRVVVDRKTLRMTIFDRAGNVLSEDARRAQFDGPAFRVYKTMPVDEHYFGLGDKTGPLDRRNQAFSLWNTDAYRFQESTDPIYKSHSLFHDVPRRTRHGCFVRQYLAQQLRFRQDGAGRLLLWRG